jgi:PAS domain S-box-containing protein
VNYECIVEISKTGKVLFNNPAFAAYFGYRPFELVNEHIVQLLSPDLRSSFAKRIRLFMDNCIRYGAESNYDSLMPFPGRHRNGGSMPAYLSFAHYENHNQFVFILRRIQDDDHKPPASLAIGSSSTLPWRIRRQNSELVIQIDESLNIIFANRTAEKRFGYEKGEMLGLPLFILFPYRVFLRYQDLFKKYFYIDDHHREQVRLTESIQLICQTKGERLFPSELHFGNVSSEEHLNSLTAIFLDQTGERSLEPLVEEFVFQDRLTDLGNENKLHKELGHILYHQRDGGTVFHLKLSRLRRIEEGLKSQIDVQITTQAASRISRLLRDLESEQFREAQIFRVAQGEFTILLAGDRAQDDIHRLAEELITILTTPFAISGLGVNQSFHMGINIGIYQFSAEDESHQVLQNALIALDSSIESGNRSWAIYQSQMRQVLERRIHIEELLQDALDRREFILYYQPIFNSDRELYGVETLLRWQSKGGEVHAPGYFLDLLEEDDFLMQAVGEWVLREAATRVAYWNRRLGRSLKLSVNVSARQITQDLPGTIGDILSSTGLAPGMLQLEITESAIMKDPEESTAVLNLLKDGLGVSLAVDDFGTGLSSLAYFSNLPVDALKLDKSFVQDMKNERAYNVIRAIISLAESSKLSLIAEGVAKDSQFEQLKNLGCQYFQGFLFDKPLSHHEFEKNYLALLHFGKEKDQEPQLLESLELH